MPESLRPYEVMIILDADLDEETIRAAVERWLTLIESNGAERGHVDWWGKRRLAYEINARRMGTTWSSRPVRTRRRWSSSPGCCPWQMRSSATRCCAFPAKVYGPPKVAGTSADRG